MTRLIESVFSSSFAFSVMLMATWTSGFATAQDTWKTEDGRTVTGNPVGVGYESASREWVFIFETDEKRTVRIPKFAFSESDAEEIGKIIKGYGARRAAERDAKKLQQQKEKAAKYRERAEQQQLEQRRKEEAWRSQKFVDSKGREWTREEITEHNDGIWLQVDRVKMKFAERTLGESESLGTRLEIGNGVLGGLQQFSEVGFPCVRSGSGYVYHSISQYMDHVGRANGKNVELLFEYTDAEQFLFMFPDGKVRTAEEMWNEALLGNWPAVRSQPATNAAP